MRQCIGCNGLVPESSASCPNCEVSAKRDGLVRALVLTTGTLALFSTGVACSPAYGVPCTKLSDGGNSCTDECSLVQSDGGSPRNNPNDTLCFTGSSDGGSP